MTASKTAETARFGALLREFRLAAGLSQEALAELATMSVDGISALERGTNQAPQRETLALLVKALGLADDRRAALEAAAVRPSRPRRTPDRGLKRHNLPPPAARLYGRESEMEAVESLLRGAAVVTLTGAGGVGKTRLALEIGERVLPAFSEGVWFVDLAPIADPELVVSAASLPFGVTELAERPPIEALTHALHRKNVLLIVDNCEHVVQAVCSLIASIVRECPSVRVLATSRQSLNIPGGRTYRVSSLNLDAGIALFEDHAKRASDDFSAGESNRGLITRIVTRLDGIALAIELAAARLRVLTLEQIDERLAERFRILTGGSPVSLPRQQTMRAAIDWSHDLLDAQEKALFRRLAVFSAGFSIDAASWVCADDRIDEWHVLDLLASLVDKSLVISEPVAGVQRYRMLETVRAYAAERLAKDSQYASLAGRHAEYYTKLAERGEAVREYQSPTPEWTAALERELENFRAALDWTLAHPETAVTGIRLLTNLQEFWIAQGLPTEASRYAQKALSAHATMPADLHALLWLTLARMQNEYHMTPQSLFQSASRACELYAEIGDSRDCAMALRLRGIALMTMGNLEAADRDLQRALEIYRKIGDLRLVSRSLGSLGGLRQTQGALTEARDILLEVLQLSVDMDDERSIIVMSMNICETDFALGDVDAAISRAKENLASDPVLMRNDDLRATQEANLAAYLLAAGRYEEARVMAIAAIKDADYYYSAVPMQHLAVMIASSDPKRAARLLGYIERVLSNAGFSRERTEMFTYERLRSALETALAPSEIERLVREGASLTQEQAENLAKRRAHSAAPDAVAAP